MFQPTRQLIYFSTIACFVLLAIVSGELSAQEGDTEGSNGGDVVTVENSPQFAKDYADIDNLDCETWGYEGHEELEANIPAREAQSAHDFLKDLLEAYPLRPHQHYLTDSWGLPNSELAFKDESDDTVFAIRLYYDEQIMELGYYPRDDSEHRSIGAQFKLSSTVALDYYSAMADCLAKPRPKAAAKFRSKAVAIWFPRLMWGVVLVGGLGAVVLSAIVPFWRSRKTGEQNAQS